jgi:nicotinate-nucleotide pyrophosphorylase (carboxylating)
MTPAGIADTPEVMDLIRRALREDIGTGDATTAALVDARSECAARIVARDACTMCGVEVARAVFREAEPTLRFDALVADGAEASPAQAVAAVRGPARGVLAAERTALNFLQRMTGIATLTRRFVERARPFNVAILDTRKTTPTLRILEKYAVRCGGGTNHRTGLYDRALVKDNHRALWRRGGRSLADAVRQARSLYPELSVEVEVENEDELGDVLPAGPDWVLLDNMEPEQLRRCVALCAGRCRVEASGGITLANVEAVAATGVDAISLGCLTHSAAAADLSLEVDA